MGDDHRGLPRSAPLSAALLSIGKGRAAPIKSPYLSPQLSRSLSKLFFLVTHSSQASCSDTWSIPCPRTHASCHPLSLHTLNPHTQGPNSQPWHSSWKLLTRGKMWFCCHDKHWWDQNVSISDFQKYRKHKYFSRYFHTSYQSLQQHSEVMSVSFIDEETDPREVNSRPKATEWVTSKAGFTIHATLQAFALNHHHSTSAQPWGGAQATARSQLLRGTVLRHDSRDALKARLRKNQNCTLRCLHVVY